MSRAKARAGAASWSTEATPTNNSLAPVLAGKEENLAHFHKIKAAAEQRGFFGDVRRALAAARRPLDDLAREIGVDPRLLSDFRAGDAELPAISLDRLLEVLGLRLMQEAAHCDEK